MEYPPQSFYIHVEVAPAYQRRGIGAALYDQLLFSLEAFHPPALRADAFTNLPQGFAFLQKRGFYEAFRETPVHLDVESFDPTPFAGLEAKLSAQGITFHTLSELKANPDCYRKLYDVYWETDKDLPREGEPPEPPPFEEWLSWDINDPSSLHDAYFIASCGEEYIGMRELGKYNQDALLGSLLGVRRAYRNRGIGLAMEVRSILYGKEHGYRTLKTCTAVQNLPMQSMFDKLGFARDPEWQQCQWDNQIVG